MNSKEVAMLVTILLPENLLWLECILRVLFAIVIGFALGVERQLRLRVAGIRIHVVVAAGAALFTVVSIYGFSGMGDTARIAAQVVTGIGFIGAGTIMHRQNAVRGLSSAAGIWLTAAIAMATGAGMYLVALCVTVLTILIQLLLNLPLRLLKEKHFNEINISFKSPSDDCVQIIKNLFEIKSFTEFKVERIDDEIINHAVIQTKKQVDAAFISKTINEHSYILSIEKTESDR